MSIYAIGDLQGCYQSFRQLLDLVQFEPSSDQLWLVGDLVNRGPDSLALLRFLKQLGDSTKIVLGNHDLHLLMVAEGLAKMAAGDTLQAILDAPDRDDLLYWLRHQPLLHTEGDFIMIHAGLLPAWTVKQAQQLANEVEVALQQESYYEIFASLYGNKPNFWDDSLVSYERLRLIVNVMTRMRVCTSDGHIDFTYKGKETHIPTGYMPWFDVPNRASEHAIIVCGHWSALGLKVRDNLIALDTGCLWGGSLTAIRLGDRKIFQVPCARQ